MTWPEHPYTYNDHPATRLTFERFKQVVDGRMRKYVKQFDSTLEIWVGDQGAPLASRLKMHAKGSLLFVIRGGYREESTHHYCTLNGRLITRQHQQWRKAESNLRLGMRVGIEATRDGDDSRATRVVFDRELKGPVSSVTPNTEDPSAPGEPSEVLSCMALFQGPS